MRFRLLILRVSLVPKPVPDFGRHALESSVRGAQTPSGPPLATLNHFSNETLSAGGETRRRTADTRLAGGIARITLGLALGLFGEHAGDAFGLPGFADLGLGRRRFFGSNPSSLCRCLALSLLGRFARQLFLLRSGLLGLADRTSLKNRLAFHLTRQHCWIVRRRLRLESLQERLLCLVCGVAPLEYVFFPVDSQVHFLAVYSRRLHTRESDEFKRQNGMPAMKICAVAAGIRHCGAMHCSQIAPLAAGQADRYL